MRRDGDGRCSDGILTALEPSLMLSGNGKNLSLLLSWAKVVYGHLDEKILVVCYTYRAVDQFLEDLLDMHISSSNIERLGSAAKATTRAQVLSPKELRSRVKLSQEQWGMRNSRKQEIKESTTLRNAVGASQEADVSKSVFRSISSSHWMVYPFLTPFRHRKKNTARFR